MVGCAKFGWFIHFKPSYDTNFALDVYGTNVDIWWIGSYPDDQSFYLERNQTYSYGGTYFMKNKATSQWVTASGYDVCVSYSNATTAMWSFSEVSKGDADIYASYYQDGQILIFPKYFDTRGAISTFHSKLGGIGYNTYDFVNTTASTAYTYMQNDSIFVTRGMFSYVYFLILAIQKGVLLLILYGGSTDNAINFINKCIKIEMCTIYCCSPEDHGKL